jgi:hypothetical protein
MESINTKTMQPSSLVLRGASDQSAPPRDVQTKKSVAADIVSASNIRSDRIEEVSNSLALQRTESGEKNREAARGACRCRCKAERINEE